MSTIAMPSLNGNLFAEIPEDIERAVSRYLRSYRMYWSVWDQYTESAKARGYEHALTKSLLIQRIELGKDVSQQRLDLEKIIPIMDGWYGFGDVVVGWASRRGFEFFIRPALFNLKTRKPVS